MRKRMIVPVLLVAVAGCAREPATTEPTEIAGVQASDAAAVAASGTGSVAASATGPLAASATGSGIIAPGIRQFSFAAAEGASGSVRGQAQLSRSQRGGGALIHMAIDCLEVSGNQATMSGSVTRSNTFGAGTPIWFRVVDNGEPPANDLITLVRLFGPDEDVVTCESGLDLSLVPIQAGNVQVH